MSKPFMSKITRRLQRFIKNENANVTILAGLAVIPMFLAAGSAIDMVRINREQQTFQSAVDSAVIAVAGSPRSAVGGLEGQALTDRISELEDYAREFLQINYKAESGSAGNVSLDLTADGNAVQVMAHNEFPMTIMKLAGVSTVELDAFAEVRQPMTPTEFSMVLDVTGSMNGTPLAALKEGVKSMIKTIYNGSDGAEDENIRMALVPFALAVRLNPGAFDFEWDWIDTGGANPLSRVNFNNAANPLAPADFRNSSNNFTAWSQLRSSVNPKPQIGMEWLC